MSENPHSIIGSESGLEMADRKHADLVQIARAQRFVCYTILLSLAWLAPVFFMSQLSLQLQYLWVLGQLAIALLQSFATFRLARTAFGSLSIGLVMGLVALIPGVGLIPLLAANFRATRLLKSKWCRVGLLGENLGQFDN